MDVPSHGLDLPAGDLDEPPHPFPLPAGARSVGLASYLLLPEIGRDLKITGGIRYYRMNAISDNLTNQHTMRNLPKVLESIGGRATKITLPTRLRKSFSRYLVKRKLILDPPYTTDVWNEVESAYSVFVLPVPNDVADLLFDDWIDECAESIKE